MTRNASPAVAALLATIAVSSPLLAQASVSGRVLPARVDTFAVTYSGQRIGTGIMARSRVGELQRSQLVQVYTWRGAGGEVIVDSLVSEAATLRPIREVRVVADTVIDVQFGDDSIRIVVRPRAGSMRRFAVPRGTMIFSSASIDALVAASPLDDAFQQTFRVYYAPPSPRGLVDVPMHVSGSEKVTDASGASRDAWVVVVTMPDGGSTYWIDKETRAVLAYDVREGPAVIQFRP